jgi:hypothetical protein
MAIKTQIEEDEFEYIEIPLFATAKDMEKSIELDEDIVIKIESQDND